MTDSTLLNSAAARPPRRCAFIGDESLAAQCADIARSAGLEVVLIATQNGQVREYAEANSIPVLDSGGDLVTTFAEHDFDVLLSVANLRVLPEALLDQARIAINFHDGPLPGYGGLNVTTWALLGGEAEHAITWHLMTADVDGGEIITTESFPVLPEDTAFSLNANCYEAALRSFPRVAEALASLGPGDELATTAQPGGTRRMFGKFQRPAVLFDPVDAGRSHRAHRACDRGRPPPPQHPRRRSPRARPHRRRRRGVRGRAGARARGDARRRSRPGHRDRRRGRAHRHERRRSALRRDHRHGRLTGVGRAKPSPAVASAPGRPCLHPMRRSPTSSRSATARSPAARRSGSTASPASNRPTSRRALERRRPGVVVGRGAGPAAPGVDADTVLAAVAAWLLRLSGSGRIAVGYDDDATRELSPRMQPLVHRPIAVLEAARRHDLRRSARRSPTSGRRSPSAARSFVTCSVGIPAPVSALLATPIRVGVGGDDPGLAADRRAIVQLRGRGRRQPRHAAPSPQRHRRSQRRTPRGAGRDAARRRGGRTRHGGQPPPVARRPPSGPRSTAINATEVDYDRDATVDGLFRAQVARTPDAPALSFGSRTLTYAELAAATDALATKLRSLGVGRGDRVGIALPRGIDMVVGVLATLELRRRVRPARPDLPRATASRFMVEDSGINVARSPSGEIAAELGHPGLAVVDPATSTRTRRAATAPTSRPRRHRPRLRDLHVGLDRPAQGRDGRAPQRRQLLRRDGPSMIDTRAARHVAGGDEPLVRHLGARAAVDADPRLPRRAQADRGIPPGCRATARRNVVPPTRAGGVQPLLLRRRRGARQPTATGCCSKAPGSPTPRVRGGVDARAPLPRVRRRLPEPGVDQRRARRDHANIAASAPAASCCRCTPRSASPRSGRSSTTSRTAGSASRSPRAGSRTTSCSTRRASPRAKERPARHDRYVQRLWRGETVADARRRRRHRSTCARCRGRCSPSCRSGSRRRAARPRSSWPARSAPTSSPTCSARRSTELGREHRAYRAGVARRPATPATATSR